MQFVPLAAPVPRPRGFVGRPGPLPGADRGLGAGRPDLMTSRAQVLAFTTN
jgi:hypothetical protein